MSLKEHAMREFQEKVSSNETVQDMITTYYEMQNDIFALVGVPNGNSTPVRGILAYTVQQLFGKHLFRYRYLSIKLVK